MMYGPFPIVCRKQRAQRRWMVLLPKYYFLCWQRSAALRLKDPRNAPVFCFLLPYFNSTQACAAQQRTGNPFSTLKICL